MNTLKTANPVAVTKRLVGLAGDAVHLAGTVARATVHAPLVVTKEVIHLAEAGASLAETVARETGHARRADQLNEHLTYTPDVGAGEAGQRPSPAGSKSGDEAAAPPGPNVVLAEPHAPDAPPVDVVGNALAVEAAADRGHAAGGDGMAHEPHGASRDEEHGHAALQRAEVDEIAEEAATALEDDIDAGR